MKNTTRAKKLRNRVEYRLKERQPAAGSSALFSHWKRSVCVCVGFCESGCVCMSSASLSLSVSVDAVGVSGTERRRMANAQTLRSESGRCQSDADALSR